MYQYFKNKITNLTSYLLGYDKVYKELDKRLAEAKNDKERIIVLEEEKTLSRELIQKLIEENAKLKEQIKEHEELDSVLSSGSNSSEGIDAKVEQEIKELERVLLTEKKSTAPIRKTIKLLKRIKKLKFLNYQKDLKIKELEQNKNISL